MATRKPRQGGAGHKLPQHEARSASGNPLFDFNPRDSAEEFPLGRAAPQRKPARPQHGKKRLPVLRRSSFTSSLDVNAAPSAGGAVGGTGAAGGPAVLMSSSLTGALFGQADAAQQASASAAAARAEAEAVRAAESDAARVGGAKGAEAGADTMAAAPSAGGVASEEVLSTGEDAVAFFSQSQPNCATKFVTLNRKVTHNAFRPYDLVVVPQLQAEPEHFTMSASGIVHVQPGEPAHVETLSDWMRESSQFNVLRSVGTFKNFLAGKCFNAWKRNVRFKLFCAQRKKLAQGLFIGMESFCQPLLEVKGAALQMGTAQLLEVKTQTKGHSNQTFEKAQFVENQAAKRAEATRAFEAAMEKTAVTVTRVCSAVRQLAKRQEAESLEFEFEQAGAATKSLMQLKEEAQQQRALIARSESEARRLTDFIRLVDYVSVGCLVELVLKGLEDFLHALCSLRKNVALFQTDVMFTEEGSVFTPTKQEMLGMVEQLVDQTILNVNSVSRIIFTEPFESVMTSVITDSPNIGNIIRNADRFKATFAAISDKVGTDYDQAQQYVTLFDSVRVVHEYDLKWNLVEYRMREHTVQSLREDISMMTEWGLELDKMRTGNACGVLYVQSLKLKNRLFPLNEAKLKEVTDVLASLFSQKCRDALEDYRARVTKLQQRPAKMEQFAQHMESMKAMKAELDEVRTRTATVEGMYELLQEHEVRVSSEDQVQLDELREVAEAYEQEAGHADMYVDESMPEMSDVLTQNIATLHEKVAGLLETLHDPMFESEEHYSEPSVAVEEVKAVQAKLEGAVALSQQYASIQTLFKMDVTEYKDMDNVKAKLDQVSKMWTTLESWQDKQDTWQTSEFTSVNWEEEAKDVQMFFKDSFSMAKKLGTPVSLRLKEEVADFKTKMPTIQELGNPNMRARHWEKVFEALGKPYQESTTLQQLLEWDMIAHAEVVGEQSATSSGEAQLEDSLKDIEANWTDLKFAVLPYRDSTTVFILGGLDDVMAALEDNQVTLQTMMGSRYIMGVRDEVETWDKKLALLSETLDEWVACQRAWMYLETIFSAEDIQKQLPVEAQKFKVVDKAWKDNMKKTNEDPIVIHCLDIEPQLLGTFQASNEALDQIQKSLEEYLETKRLAFARFFFLSNDELLEILSQTRDPHAVQPHMVKCFDAIKKIKFDDEPGCETHVLGMCDPLGEYCAFSDFTKAEGPVEHWLTDIEGNMRQSLYDLAKQSYTEYPSAECDEAAIERTDWFWKWPAAVTIVIDEIFWTNNLYKTLITLEKGENPKAMPDFLDFSVRQIARMVETVRGPLDKLQRTLMGALLTIDVHARDVVKAMVRDKTETTIDFNWTKQLRYYWPEEKDNCICRQTNACFDYMYEFLGNSFRLVITPLTDLCYMTLTGALHLKLGGAPAGPAGTGKTETTKDLGKAIAVQCVVFNCSDGLDYKIMGRFFKGLAMAGAWACFDEFNRIDIEVLSVIAQQIMCIQQAIIKELPEFEFEGTNLPLGRTFGVFITMNPGYAGRTELPDNLKALFRPVAMMVPDYRMIAEIVLFSQGFANALPLSNKMSQLYALTSEQLSKQDHYDFGMRAVKTVLVAAGLLKRKEPETFEDLLLIRAMRDSNVPKFLSHDLPLFYGILDDLFPGVEVPFVDYGLLQKAIENQLRIKKLQVVPEFVEKVIQVHETQLVRHGMMVVGEAAAGKSTNVMILAEALGQLKRDGVKDRDEFFQIVNRLILNPKSISAGELFGSFNLLTGEWADGLVPKLFRESVSKAEAGSTDRSWILFDGPVDAVWIENMNTVLDDNRMLCLANSERIKMSATMHMMFEVQDLKVASPATVSRCGMVFMEQVHVGANSLLDTWALDEARVELLGENAVQQIVTLAKVHVAEAEAYMREFCKEKVATTAINLMQSLLNLITSMIERNGVNKDSLGLERLVDFLFVYGVVWSVGGNTTDDTRKLFNDWCLKRFKDLLGEHADTIENLYDLAVDVENVGWTPWDELMDHFEFDPKQAFFEILVPTIDTTRYTYLLDTLLRRSKNLVFMAETGVGKSVVIQNFLDRMALVDEANEDGYVSFTMGYSAQTTPSNLKTVMETKLEKKRKNLFGPPSGKLFFLFIDDMNMPSLETYGAQPPNELLRQIVDDSGFYDTGKLFWKAVHDITVVGACAPPGGGRNELSPRLLTHFNLVWLPQLSVGSMKTIFAAILGGFLRHELPESAPLADSLVTASVDIYERVQREMLPTPTKSHYTFNLRDLSKVFQGVLMVKHKFCDNQRELKKLWVHEECRVFRDRLVDDKDRSAFNVFLKDALEEDVPRLTEGEEVLEVAEFENILFGDYLTREDKQYREVENLTKLNDLLLEYLEEYNITFPTQMDLVFFHDAMYHISRICRVMRQPRGNALLVGVGGSGRQSLTRLASFMADYRCKMIEITRGYGSTEFRDDLKDLLMFAGCENKPITFLFSDAQIVEESFLEDINNMLNTGEVPNLYAPDEMEQIVNRVRPLAKAAGKLETRDVVLAHYVHLVRENLHICLAFSPIGAGFRNRCRMFPSLVNCCTIDWFSAWPSEALRSVSARFLEEAKEDLGIEEAVGPLCDMMVTIHRSIEDATGRFFAQLGRYNYTTPTSYLELIKLYCQMLKQQRELVSTAEKRYRVGLQKLEETEGVVHGLEKDLTELQPVIKKAQKDTGILLKQVEKDQVEADKQKAIVQKDVDAANVVAADVGAMKEDCQRDLDEALPAYYDSIKALDALDKKAVGEVKNFANPPDAVKLTLDAVCILFGEKEDWKTAKKLMSDMKFIDNLKGYDKDNISPKAIKKLNKFMTRDDFTPEAIEKVSSACKCMCLWVRAMHTYDRVAKGIAPKKAALADAEAKLAGVMAELKVKQDALQVVLDKVAKLQADLQGAQQKKADLEAQEAKTQAQLKRAHQLIDSLASEKTRWTEAADKLASDLHNLIGNMVLGAGCIAYLGPFTSEFRNEMTGKWTEFCKAKSIPVDGNFALDRILGEPVTIREWIIQGLPADTFSIENGMFATMGRRWPLMIDPQGQANRWVRNSQKEHNLQVIKLTQKDFLRTLENAIRYGASVLLENVLEDLDPSLEPVLLKQIFKKGGQWLLRLGDSDVPYSDEFRFFITTKLANPHYMPEVCIKVTIINFTVTLSGLEDQLLVDVISNERLDLQQKSDELVVSVAGYNKQLKQIEDTMLRMLAESTGNILDDEKLINVLADSKKTSVEVNQAKADAEVTSKEIETTREGYRVVATRASIIYFVIASMAEVDPMYQYSLQYYQQLFRGRLTNSEQNDDVAKRIDILINDVTLSMYNMICRGLFDKDKLVYAFMIGVQIERNSGKITPPEWTNYMLGPGAPKENKPAPPNVAWLQEGKPVTLWDQLTALQEQLPDVFDGLTDHVKDHTDEWFTTYINNAEPHNADPPSPWNERLNSMGRLLLVRVLRTEMTAFATRVFTIRELGPVFGESPPFDLGSAYNDSDARTPLIFVLSAGADPNDALLELAAKVDKEDGLKIISLGQGQGPIAERLMTQARMTGDWVCLQNCHLAVSWLPRMEQLLETAQTEDVNDEYRLWLTSMPSNKFPEVEEVPYETLNVTVGEVSYGGRVTDKWDKICNMAVIRKYFTPDIMTDGFAFDPDGVLVAPPEGPLADVRTYVAALPMEDKPTAFGLHPNADISFQQQQTRIFLDTVIICGGKGGGGGDGGGMDADAKVSKIANIIIERMPKEFDRRLAHAETLVVKENKMISLGVFLLQEMERFNNMNVAMVAVLKMLDRAIQGLVVMSGELEAIYHNFVFNQVPKVWGDSGVGYPSLQPLASWIEDFFERLKTLSVWLVDGPPTSYWLSGFFFPQGFMTAVKQTFSRKYHIAVDTLLVGCQMTNVLDFTDQKKAPDDGAYFYGAYMQGARFDTETMKMADSKPKIIFDPMPLVLLDPMKKEEFTTEGCYNCPVYKTSERRGILSTTGHSTNFVVSLAVPSDESGDHWTRGGVAMLLMLDA
eukprot:g1492.t1